MSGFVAHKLSRFAMVTEGGDLRDGQRCYRRSGGCDLKKRILDGARIG